MLEDAFLQNIQEQPDDDAVRLIYADWLLERGDPASAARGEFIQVQVQLARSESLLANWDEWAALTGRVPQLRAREKILLEQYADTWARPVTALVRRHVFRRGFIDAVTLSVGNFLQHGADLFRLAPIREVRFNPADRPLTQLAACPFLERLRTIDLTDTYIGGNAAVSALLSSSHLPRLRVLRLGGTWLGDAALRALAESRTLTQLEALDLSRTSVTLRGVRALLDSPHWSGACRINLAGARHIVPSTLETLAASLWGTGVAPLQAVLQFFSTGAAVYRNGHARRLAQLASAEAQPATVLGRGLGASHRRARAAAAQMLARLGTDALAKLPGLVRRLYDRRQNRRDEGMSKSAAATLLHLLPALPEKTRTWMAYLANPLRRPEANLRDALEGADLPEAVLQGFTALCERRAAWRTRLTVQAEDQGPARPPRTGGEGGPWPAAQVVLRQAEQFALRHRTTAQEETLVVQGGRDKEAAWLLARLCELLLPQGTTAATP